MQNNSQGSLVSALIDNEQSYSPGTKNKITCHTPGI